MTKQKEAKYREGKKFGVTCECGFVVVGFSQAHAEGLLKNHKKSINHRDIMNKKLMMKDGTISSYAVTQISNKRGDIIKE